MKLLKTLDDSILNCTGPCRSTRAAVAATDHAYETVHRPGPLGPQSSPTLAHDPQAAYTPLIKTPPNRATEGRREGMKAIYANVPNAARPETAVYAEVSFESTSPASGQRQVTPRAAANDDVIVAYVYVP